jgi:hypothetical protein
LNELTVFGLGCESAGSSLGDNDDVGEVDVDRGAGLDVVRDVDGVGDVVRRLEGLSRRGNWVGRIRRDEGDHCWSDDTIMQDAGRIRQMGAEEEN